MNMYMYEVSVDVPFWHLFFVICVLLRGNGTFVGIGGMVGYRYCMWVEYRVEWNVRVFALSSSSLLLGTLLPL